MSSFYYLWQCHRNVDVIFKENRSIEILKGLYLIDNINE